MGKVSCEACNRGCKGQAIRLNDRYYHLKCFKCTECKKPLATGGFYTKDDVHYCVEDYQRLFGTRCHACGQFVEGEVVTALGNTYHEHCFHCTGCQKRFESGDKVTCVDKDYLCNSCLRQIGAGSPVYEEPRTKKSLQVLQGSASAPTTPAKQDYSANSVSGLTDSHLSSPTLDISADSMAVVETSAPVINGITLDTLLSPPLTNNTSGYKSDMSFDNYTGMSNGDVDPSHENIDVPVFFDSMPDLTPFKGTGPSHRGRFSPIQNIMRYRSVSPWSAMSHASQKSKDSGGGSGRSSRFDADYGKFYNSSYLEKSANFQRGPSQNAVNMSRDKSPRHYHRPENFSYMQGRRDIIKPGKKGLLTMLGDRSYGDSLRQLERYKPDKAQEPIRLSKIPDAHKHVGYVAPIERDDWPSPPAPAAAYPELLRNRVEFRCKSTDRLTDHVDGVDNKENVNGVAGSDDDEMVDSKTVKEMEELSKIKNSGAAKVILKDLKKRQHEKYVLDPRSSSRTPSAAAEPPYRPRYDSPLFASPSRDIDLRIRLRSVESLKERKYRTAALVNIPVDWRVNELPKNIVRNPSVPRPGYTLSVKSANYDSKKCYSFDGLEVVPPQRPVSSAGELNRNIYSSQSSINEFDPTTGLRRYQRTRSYTVCEGTASPYWGYRRSVPSLFKVDEPAKIYSYEQLRKMFADNKLPIDVDKEHLECHLAPTEFDSRFGMTYEEFHRLPEWKRNDMKSRIGLF